LHEGRTQVVFGNGSPDADLMFVGEAPGFHEDKQGLPFVGQAGKLLDKLLAGIGLTRADVFVCNVLKCRPPGNRDPVPDEKEACEPYLFRQVELIRPKVIATLGNHATKRQGDRHHARARTGAAAEGRGVRRAALPALSPGRRAVHPGDADGARAGLRAAARAARP
jgi:DNA polymerase